MKKITLLALALLSLAPAFAQQRHLFPARTPNSPQQQKHLQFIQSLLRRQSEKGTAQKPTAIKQRVIAQAIHEDGEIDSTTFRYSGTRGSEYNFNNMELLYKDYFDGFYGGAFQNSPPEFGALKASDMLADSIAYYYEGDLYDLSYAYYRSDNQIDSFYDNYYNNGMLSDLTLIKKVYNSQGYITEVYQLSNNSFNTALDTLSKQGIYYNNDFSRVLSDTMWNKTVSGYELNRGTAYFYNTTGQLDSLKSFNAFALTISPGEKGVLTYYPNGKIKTVTVYDISTLIPENLESRDSFGYQAGIDYFTFWKEDNWFQFQYEGGSIAQQFPGVNGLPDSIIISSRDEIIDPFEQLGILIYQYNSFNNPVKETIAFADNTPSAFVNFYYEEYEDSVNSIHSLTDNKDFSVYPNPFTDNINIDYKGDKTIQPVTIKLVNILGQALFHEKRNLHQGHNSISLPETVPGNYFLVLKSPNGQVWSRKMLKQ